MNSCENGLYNRFLNLWNKMMIVAFTIWRIIELYLFSTGKKTKVDLLNVEKTIKNSKKLVVVVIDFGTMFSGFAFSLTYNWRKVFYRIWSAETLATRKTTTCLLLKKDLSESFFGYEAEEKFTEMTPEDRLHSYFYFHHFGIILHDDLVSFTLSLSLPLALFLSLFFFLESFPICLLTNYTYRLL